MTSLSFNITFKVSTEGAISFTLTPLSGNVTVQNENEILVKNEVTTESGVEKITESEEDASLNSKVSYSEVASKQILDALHQPRRVNKNFNNDFLPNIEMVKEFITELNVEKIKNERIWENKGPNVNFLFISVGILHSIALSFNWKYHAIPPWIVANTETNNGFKLDTARLDSFFEDKEKLKNSYWVKLNDIKDNLMPLLPIFFDERPVEIDYEEFLNNLGIYQVCYFMLLTHGRFNKNEDIKVLKNKILKSIKDDNTFNKSIFKIIAYASSKLKTKIDTEPPK